VGLKPCPLLEVRGGVWRFDDSKPGQKLADGERFATGVRNSSALAWRDGDNLYTTWHGRDGTSKGWPELVSEADDASIPDEMFRVTKGSDMGWPYTYWDAKRKVRLDGAGIWRRRQDAGDRQQICQAGRRCSSRCGPRPWT
jgi:glucose/arabinose dehydrogenase